MMDALTIAHFLGKELYGKNVPIENHSSLSNPIPKSVVFAKNLAPKNLGLLSLASDVLVIANGDPNQLAGYPMGIILSDNPRLDFVKVVREFFSFSETKTGIHPTAVVEDGAVIGEGVSIGANCFIGCQVQVGRNTEVLPNVSIYGKVRIGENCYIKPGVVIGGPGFGFEYDLDGRPLQFPHTGEVIIGNDVYIGANVTIDRATMDATVIEDSVKIDNLVHISHNCHIKKNTLVTAGAIFSGGTEVGEGAWIAPNSTTHQKVKIGDKSTVGIGSVVLRSVKPNTTVFGNPASKVEQQ